MLEETRFLQDSPSFLPIPTQEVLLSCGTEGGWRYHKKTQPVVGLR